MVVEQVNVGNVTILEPKNNPPVRPDGDTPVSGEVAFERVQSEAGQIHVLGPCGASQKAKHTCDLIDVFRVSRRAVRHLHKGVTGHGVTICRAAGY